MQINDDDPNASLTRKRVQSVKNCCISSGLLDKRFATVHYMVCGIVYWKTV